MRFSLFLVEGGVSARSAGFDLRRLREKPKREWSSLVEPVTAGSAFAGGIHREAGGGQNHRQTFGESLLLDFDLCRLPADRLER